MECEIVPMTLNHFFSIEPFLKTQFDDFWKPSVLREELENPSSHYFIAVHCDKILGFAGIWKAVDDCHITDIVVKKDCRMLGIGSKLLEKLIQEAKTQNVDSLTLEVNSNNIPAQRLYKKYGFKTLGIRKRYYNNIDDAIIMTLYLK